MSLGKRVHGRLTIAGFCLAAGFLALPPGAGAQATQFSQASLHGSYGFVLRDGLAGQAIATGNGSGIRAMGVMAFDGRGGVTGYRLLRSFLLYPEATHSGVVPWEDYAETPIRQTFTGTYTIDPGGTGVIRLTLEDPVLLGTILNRCVSDRRYTVVAQAEETLHFVLADGGFDLRADQILKADRYVTEPWSLNATCSWHAFVEARRQAGPPVVTVRGTQPLEAPPLPRADE